MSPKFSNSGIRKILFPVIFIVSLFVLPQSSFPEESGEIGFSSQRLHLRPEVAEKISEGSRVQEELVQFADNYSKGLSLYDEGRPREAVGYLLTARKAWPEYFYTDLLLALTYEDLGNYRLAARYFKSYLNKLNEYQKGNYRISGPLIHTISSGWIESYDSAHKAVAERMGAHGIKLAWVRPVYTPPLFLMPAVGIIFLVASYVMMVYVLIPLIRRKQRENNPPEGFWVCRNCGEYNPDLARECVKCRKPKD